MSLEIAMAGDSLYSAVLVGRLGTAGGLGHTHDYQVTYELRLFRATDAETAYDQAMATGRFYENERRNPAEGAGQDWRFLGLAELGAVPMDEIPGGALLYRWSTVEDPDEVVLAREQLACFVALERFEAGS
jgi:Domain of unknown function (DUF4288)